MVGWSSIISRRHTSSKSEISKSSSKVKPIKPSSGSAVPTTKDYAFASVSKAIHILKSVNTVAGVPGAKPGLELALSLIDAFQAVPEIGEDVEELKTYIERIAVIIVRDNDTNAIPRDLIEDINELRTDFEAIKRDLDSIAGQNRFLVGVFKTENKAKIDRCNELLRKSLKRWEVSRHVNQSILLNKIEQKIALTGDQISNIQPVHKTTLSREIPPPPNIFYGRDEFVGDIVNLLTSPNSDSKPPRICIHAQGGIGKTSAALIIMAHPKIIEKFGEAGRFWMPCVQATSADLFLKLLYDNFHITRDTRDPLSDIMHELKASSSPRLVLLDNFETPWDAADGGREDVENILNHLSSISHLSILVTMRANTPPTEQITWIDKPLDVVDPETSYKIYCAIHLAAERKPQLEELLVELGHMPFAITVMAKLGKSSKSMPATLLKRWRAGGLGILKADGEKEDNISRSIGLSMNGKTMMNNVAARTILATLALLPAGTTHKRLELWIPQLGTSLEAAISALNNVALIIDSEQPSESGDVDSDISIAVHPVVRSYMERDDHISAEVRETVRKACCQFMLEHSSGFGNPNYKDDIQALSTEEVNLQSVLLGAIRQDGFLPLSEAEVEEVLQALIELAWYQHYTKLPSTHIIEQTLSFARKHGHKRYIAESLFCLGCTLTGLSKIHEARDTFIEARDYFKKLSDSWAFCDCSFQLSNIHLFLSEPALAKQALDDISEEDLGPPGGFLRARENLSRGKYFRHVQEKPEALACLTTAKKILESDCYPLELSRCLYLMAGILAQMLQFKDSLEAIDEALKISEEHALPIQLLHCLMIKSAILLHADVPIAELLPTLKHFLEKALIFGHPLCIGWALELHGELYAREREVSKAIKFYEAAEEKYRTISEAGMKYCRDNLDRLVSVESNKEGEVKVKKLSKGLL